MQMETSSSWANLFPADLLGKLGTFLDPESVGSFAVTAGPQISRTIKRAWLKKNFEHLFEHRDNPITFRAFLEANDDWRDWYDEPGLLSVDDKRCFNSVFKNMPELIWHGQVEVVRHLIEVRGHDVNKVEETTGKSPLYYALLSDDVPMLQCILSIPGLDVNARQPVGRWGPTQVAPTMLHLAAREPRVSSECLALLLSHRDIDVNITDEEGDTPLHYVVFEDNEEKLLHLLGHRNIKVNARNSEGRTPLHFAVVRLAREDDFERLVKHLVEAGADIHTNDFYGCSPLGDVEGEQAALLKRAWFEAVLEQLRSNYEGITELDFEGYGLDAQDASALAEALEDNTSLTELNLDGNNIGTEGAAALADALKANTSLTNLWLDGNTIDDEGAAALADALKANTSLTDLGLGDNTIGNKGIFALADALMANTSLTDLWLRSNVVGDAGAEAMAKALKVNATLTDLDLGSNFVGNAGAVALAEAVKFNSTLTYLNLFDNDIKCEGAAALAEALRANVSLTAGDLEDKIYSTGNEGDEVPDIDSLFRALNHRRLK